MTEKKKTALIVGGAGYIGSHCNLYMNDAGWDTVVLDNLCLGHTQSVLKGKLVQGDLGDPAMLDHVFTTYDIDTVLHFAAFAQVGESQENPAKYYQNNVVNAFTLLEGMLRHNVKKLVFSSTCAVYGEPEVVPIAETTPKNPINVYGFTKLVFEKMATDLAMANGLAPVFLRYFNAAGCDPEGRLGEDHMPESHIIPIAIDSALGRRDKVTIFGTDYQTPDGTCIRDYIHVKDLIDAHIKAIEYLDGGGKPTAFNIGTGEGFSVKEVIDAVSKVHGSPTPVVEGKRRDGDPPKLVAAPMKAEKELGWKAKIIDLETIVKHAYDWRRDHPEGYAGSKKL